MFQLTMRMLSGVPTINRGLTKLPVSISCIDVKPFPRASMG